MSSIKIRTKRLDGYTQIRTLIAHPMETGRNRDKETGEFIPAFYIQELTVKHQGKIIASTVMGPSISKNPYFAFQLKGGNSGDEISISWLDNKGNSDTEVTTIK